MGTISDSNNRVEDMEGTPTVVSIGSGKAGAKELVTFLQGAASVSRKTASTTLGGVGISVGGVDMTAGDDMVWISKSLLTDYQDVNSAGWLVAFGSSAANLNEYIIVDDGTLGDRGAADVGLVRGGWVVEAIDANNLDWFDTQPATAPTLTGITHYVTTAGLAVGGAKAENIFLDSVDLGDGLYLVGTAGLWADFVGDDEGSQTAGRFGHFLTNPSGIEVRGKAIRGRTSGAVVTATTFADSLQNLTWVGGRVSAGWNELEDDLGDAGTSITEANTSFTGAGRDNLKRWFDSENEVDGTNEVILITAHSYLTGEAILYSAEGGTDVSGLTDATRYFVNRDTGTARDANGFSLHTTRANSYANTSPIDITAAGSGEQHSFRRQPDTRPVYTASDVSGTASYTNCNFIRFASLTLTAGVTMTSCNLVNCSALTLGAGTLDSCTIVTPLLAEDESFVATSDLADLVTCAFEEGDEGHAIEIDTIGSYSFIENTFSGYWTHANAAGDGAQFNTTSGAGVDDTGNDITTDDTHGLATGDAVFYEDGGGSDDIGLEDGYRFYTNVISTTNFSLHVTKEDATTDANRVNLNNTGTGETHTVYSSKAAIVNRSGGLVTIDVTDGGTPFVRNVGAATTVVNVSVPLVINGVTEGSRGVMIATDDSSELLGGYANSSGIISGGYSGSTPRAVSVKVRNSGIINAAVQEEDGVGFTDFTNDARDKTGVDDVDLLPATISTNDSFNFGGLATFEQLEINVTTVGDTYVLTWEYFNGSWVSLTVVDDTNSFQTLGWNFVTFTAPDDWATTSVNSQGPFFYVRARVTTGGGTQPQAEEISLNRTTKYLPFNSSGSIEPATGLTSTAVWIEDPNVDFEK